MPDDSRLETVQQVDLQGLLVKVVDGGISDRRLIGGKTAAFSHHLSQFGIVEHLTLVGTVLHPDDTLVVVIGFVQSLFDMSHDDRATLCFNGLNVKQDGGNHILRRHVSQQVRGLLNFLIR